METTVATEPHATSALGHITSEPDWHPTPISGGCGDAIKDGVGRASTATASAYWRVGDSVLGCWRERCVWGGSDRDAEDLCGRSMSSAVISKCTIRPTSLVLLDPAVAGRRRGCRPAHSGLDASIAHLAEHQKAPHLSKWSLSSTGGGALRWPSGSTLVRIDGPPSLRAAHPPSLAAGPATSDGTLARPRLQEAGCPGREWVSLNRSRGTLA